MDNPETVHFLAQPLVSSGFMILVYTYFPVYTLETERRDEVASIEKSMLRLV